MENITEYALNMAIGIPYMPAVTPIAEPIKLEKNA